MRTRLLCKRAWQQIPVKSLALVILMNITSMHAQWALQSPIPTNNNLNGAAFATATHIFICGREGLLLESTDAGTRWVQRMGSVGSDPFYTIEFSDPLHGYVTGNNQDAWRTTDGGITWLQMTSVPFGSQSHLDFITPVTGFLGGNGVLSFTSDGGINWIVQSAYPTCPVIYGMDFRDAQVGLVGGTIATTSETGIFKTTDAGSTWTKKFPSSANDILWLSNTEAIATVGVSIYRSTDAGETWSQLSSAVLTGLLDMERVGSSSIVGVSGGGDIWRSTDKGINWTLVLDGIGDLPTQWSVSFHDSLKGLVVGQAGLIYSTIDGGITWRMLNNGMGVQIYDLEMKTNNFGICAANNGYVFRTTNGGGLWEVQKVEVTGQIFGRDESLRAASIVDTGFAVIAGPGGIVFRTYNAGTSWESVGYPALPGSFWIEDVKFVNRNDGWIVGLDQDLGHTKTIYKTTNGGSLWTQAITSGAYMYSTDFVDPLHGWVATAGNRVYRTTNGGTNWTEHTYPPYFTTPRVSKIRFFDQNNGWVVGWDGFAARTVDGGNNWTIVNIGSTADHLFGLSVVSPSEVWAVGRENLSFDGLVYHTTNSGATWTREVVTHYTQDLPYSISALPSGDVWFGGFNGRIFKKDGVTGVRQDADKTIPQAVRLYQNYPNPFNPTTTITFAIPQSSFTTLKVYNLLGQAVATLMNDEMKPGTYEVKWSASGQASGLYLYQLKAAGITETKRMVLLK